jgi:hypothetical protein
MFSNTDELVEAMRRLHGDSALREVLAANAYRAGRERWFEQSVMERFFELVEQARAARRGRLHAARV